MTRIVAFSIIFLTTLACTQQENKSIVTDTTSSAAVSESGLAKEGESLQADSSYEGQLLEEGGSETELFFIVSVAEGYNYDSLKSIAQKTASSLSYKFDTLGRYFHPQKGIILPEDDEDEIYAGGYFLRRFGEDRVSIEMSHAYMDTSIKSLSSEWQKITQDTMRMFVFAAMYPGKRTADSLAAKIKVQYPSSKVVATKIYMGCMH